MVEPWFSSLEALHLFWKLQNCFTEYCVWSPHLCYFMMALQHLKSFSYSKLPP
jgi:hypothetical protein